MIMHKETRLNKWGNCLGLRLPKEFTDLAGLENKSIVRVELNDGALLISPLEPLRKRKPLAEILETALEIGAWDGTPAETTPEDREWLDMPSVGAEIVE
jgi:antitoxin component of MazEF toxin-antitoxin module